MISISYVSDDDRFLNGIWLGPGCCVALKFQKNVFREKTIKPIRSALSQSNQFRCLHTKSQVRDPHAKIKPILTLRHQTQADLDTYITVFIDPHTKIKSTPTRTLKSTQFRCTTKTKSISTQHQNQVISKAHIKTKSIAIPTLKWSQLRSPTMKPSQFQSPTQETKSNSMLIPKPSVFRQACKNQENFKNPHKNWNPSIPH